MIATKMIASRALPVFLASLSNILKVQAHGYVEAVIYQGQETTMFAHCLFC